MRSIWSRGFVCYAKGSGNLGLAFVAMLLVVQWAPIIDDVVKLAANNSVYTVTTGLYWQAGASNVNLGGVLSGNFAKGAEPKPLKEVMAKPIVVLRRQKQKVLAPFFRSEFFVATARLVCDGAYSRLRNANRSRLRRDELPRLLVRS